MQQFGKKTSWLIASALVVILALGVAGMALADAGQGWFGMSSSSMMGNTGGMMGNGNRMGGSGGMMGSGVLQGTPAVGVSQVTMTDQDTFSPAIVQVPVGTTITWTNADTDAHTVTFMAMMYGGMNGGMDGSGDVASHATFSRTFTQVGLFYYRCMYHQEMVGEVIVTG